MSMEPTSTQNEVIFTPTIKLQKEISDVIFLDVELAGDVTGNGVYQHEEVVGRANLQIFNEKWISGSLTDYVEYALKNASALRYNELQILKNLLTSEMIHLVKDKGTIAYLHHFELFPQYRGRGLTKPYLWLLLKCLKEEIRADYVMLMVHPEGEFYADEIANEQKRLIQLYSRNGFSKIKTKKPVMNNSGIPTVYMWSNLANKSFDKFS
ncbi:hypothetical protein PP175_23985 [Aneurinibacillus sp. Ricciae_BoGa-3]|uniref:hypothetical protein n=1 Tax=Aneurinibacillus sp. Ricciae_BoGa-3 TaxID=3022697 RepID=UPI0023423AD1|nr:hypothetical protein [Aneurinibacillus sp. Ricciae_BoGa-3]WCK54306.1 hypothetical protein PP175_23985 [Aneurinibacillus sp. Ricciae_BoGa-3]